MVLQVFLPGLVYCKVTRGFEMEGKMELLNIVLRHSRKGEREGERARKVKFMEKIFCLLSNFERNFSSEASDYQQ